ncbi:hypothetical protein D3C76_1192430 [compost metagenome]
MGQISRSSTDSPSTSTRFNELRRGSSWQVINERMLSRRLLDRPRSTAARSLNQVSRSPTRTQPAAPIMAEGSAVSSASFTGISSMAALTGRSGQLAIFLDWLLPPPCRTNSQEALLRSRPKRSIRGG